MSPVNPLAWDKGSVFVRCARCDVVHKVKDNLKIFHELAGQVYPFGYHQEYFARAIRPHLDCGRVRLVEAPSFSQKLDLLAHARAVLVPSLCEETSSLVSLEAMACGTPVIALRRGGVPEVVADGVTGLLTDTPAELPALIARAASLDSRACRRHVERSFSARRMAAGYARLYRRLLA